jgi:1-deoxy-D-xylulose-5-phosphate synthase
MIDDGPSAFRYPRGVGIGAAVPEDVTPYEIGKGRIVRQGEGLAVLSIGTRLKDALGAAEVLAAAGAEVTVADARFAKPVDTDLVKSLLAAHDNLIILEEGSAGGFAAHVMQFIHNDGLADQGKVIRVMTLPDMLIDHNSQDGQLAEAGLDAPAITDMAASLLGLDAAALRAAR